MIIENILGMKVNPSTYSQTVEQIETWIQKEQTKFISIAAVNNLVCALKDPQIMAIENRADMVTTDGTPLVWILKKRGYKNCSRVYGPTLMLHVLKMAEQKGHGIFLYGCTDELLDKLIENLKKQFPQLNIAGRHAPPFRPLTDQESDDISKEINDSGAQLVFVGLSSPKQEVWMDAHKKKLNKVVMLGVGAAFLFHAGEVKQAPPILQKLGLEWLFRLVNEPKRLWRRYLIGNSYFIWKLLTAGIMGK